MDTMARSNTVGMRSYEDFVPSSEWIEGEGSDTLIIELPSFKKEQLKVQLDNYGNLRTSGERPLDGNRWGRFHKEFRVPENINAGKIHAKFELGSLIITLPKLIIEAETKPVSTVAPQLMPRPSETETDSAKSGNGKWVSATSKPTETAAGSAKLENGKGLSAVLKPSGIETGSAKSENGKGATTMLKASETETVSAKSNNGKGINETEKVKEVVQKEEMVKNGVGGLLAGMEMNRKKRQLMINVAVAAVVLMGVGIYVAYKLKEVAKDEIGEQLYVEF